MGVMTVSSQNFMEIDMPGWWLSGASVDLDFRNGRYYDSSNILAGLSNLLSISRASIGYAKTSGGMLTQFSSGVMRITDLGLLIEDARTNLCLSSGDLRAAGEGNAVSGWTAQATTATLSGTAPDGSSTATQITATAGTGDHERFQLFAHSNTAVCTFSVFLKAGTTSWAQVQVNGLQADHSAFFNLSAGTIGTLGTNSSASIEAYQNGWYRCVVTSTNTISNLNNLIPTVMPATADNQAFNWNAAGTETIFAWGAQMEEASFASSYIPTTTTSATRAADNVTTTGSLETVMAGTTASVLLDARMIPSSGTQGGSMLGQTSNPGDRIISPVFNSNNSFDVLMGGGGLPASPAFLTNTFETGVKMGASWDGSGRSGVGDGGIVRSDATSEQYSGHRLGDANVPNSYYYARRLTVWNTRLADATLQALTKP
jgi:hypothetical protein